MNTNTKKQKETNHLNRFVDCFKSFPIGEIIPSEKPDFLITTQNGILGIELTQILKPGSPDGSSPQAQESLQRTILFKAKTALRNDSVLAEIHVLFNSAEIVKKMDVDSVAQSLVDIVIRGFKENQADHFFIEESDDLEIQLLPDCIDFISCKRLNKTTASFCPILSSFVHPINSRDIQRLIDSKERSRMNYSQECSYYWLILVEDGHAPSSFLELNEDAKSNIYRTSFQKVFYFKSFEKLYYDLKVSR